MNYKKLQVAIPMVVLAIASIAFVLRVDFGTTSALGWQQISLLCPLGALGTMIADHTILPRQAVSIVIAIIIVLVFARGFCAWVCPVPVVSRLRNLFKKNEKQALLQQGANSEGDLQASSSDEAPQTSPCSGSCASCAKSAAHGNASKPEPSRYAVLGAAIISTFIFGFPVFCMVCPIGLTFAAIFMVVRLFAFGDVTWGIVLVIGLLLVEVVFFKKWCHTICPLGAFMSIVARGNIFFKPKAKTESCIETKTGTECGLCAKACPEGIDPRHPENGAGMHECTKCRACVEACPAKAISMPLR